MKVITEEARRDLRIGTDCGLFDPIRQIWYVLDESWNYYVPQFSEREQDDDE